MSAVKATHGSSTKLVTTAHTVFQFEVFYSTQYHLVVVVVRWYYRFFLFFAMGKMVICSMNIIWKIFLLTPFTSSLVLIPFCIFDNTRILLIPPMNITHTKNGGTKLISTVGSLHI
jgi:hypothetical protein